MKTLYIECDMGCAGDMLSGALSQLVDTKAYVEKLNSAGIPGVEYRIREVKISGITGAQSDVLIKGEMEGEDHHHEHHEHDRHDHDHHHHGMNMKQIHDIIDSLHVSERVKKDAWNVYCLIGEAESRVHGEDVSMIHFHEVGMMDGIADVVAAAVAMEMIDPDRVVVSKVATGKGSVKCAHGLLPVPAPATAILLEGMPWYRGNIETELLTPTGAALLKYYGDAFDEDPVLYNAVCGYGMGHKKLERLNCVRVFLGETDRHGGIVELICNLDDMSPEGIGYAQKVLFEEGALDVYTVSAQMKKNRPGLVFTCMCRRDDKEKMIELMFRHLSTLGIRETSCVRHSLYRELKEFESSFGTVRVKYSDGHGVHREKIEYDDLARIADETGKGIEEIRTIIHQEMK